MSNEAAEASLIDEILREGARLMLAAELQAEVAAYVEAFTDEVDEVAAGGLSAMGAQASGWRPRRRAPLWCVR